MGQPTFTHNPRNSLDWRIKGGFLFAKGSRRLRGDWYGGLLTRLVDAKQSIETNVSTSDLDTGSDVRSVGVGLHVEYDSRDMPLNSRSGHHFKIDGLFNDDVIGSDQTYQSYSAAYQSHHELTDSLVLAWETQACKRAGTAPLWDACTIKLRGFAADRLPRQSDCRTYFDSTVRFTLSSPSAVATSP